MTTLLQFEPDPVSETEEPRPIYSLGGWEVAPPLPVEHGVFTFALTDIRQVLECAFSLLQLDILYQGVMEQAWQKRWKISPAEYYPAVLELLALIEATAGTLDWEVFEPAYHVERLALGALEIRLGEAKCKACQRDYRAAELEVFDWSWSDFAGSEYVCPVGHVLFRHTDHILGAIDSPYRRSKREHKAVNCVAAPKTV